MNEIETKEYLMNCPEKEIEKFIDGQIRHKTGVIPTDYLEHWLKTCRPFAYATKDDSWGELEKLLTIILTNYIKNKRELNES